jgi:hypothetical protein
VSNRLADPEHVPLTCTLLECDERTAKLVDHPGRPEPHTALCAHHAEIARDELGAEVIESL